MKVVSLDNFFKTCFKDGGLKLKPLMSQEMLFFFFGFAREVDKTMNVFLKRLVRYFVIAKRPYSLDECGLKLKAGSNLFSLCSFFSNDQNDRGKSAVKKTFVASNNSEYHNDARSAPNGVTNHLIMVGQFACLNEPYSYVGWSLVLLVGSPMPKRSKGRDQTKNDPLVFQVGGLGVGLTTLPHKNTNCYRSQKRW